VRITRLQEHDLEDFYLYKLNEGDIWMSADLDFLDELFHGLSLSEIDWAIARLNRIKAAIHPEKIARKTIIRKQED